MRRDATAGRESGDGPDHLEREELTDLLRDLAEDSRALLRQEVSLAKLEARETVEALARDGAKLTLALGLAALGALALTAFLVLVIGALLNGAYWAGALIVGVLFMSAAGLLALDAYDDLRRRDYVPTETIATLRDDGRWARRELRDIRRGAPS